VEAADFPQNRMSDDYKDRAMPQIDLYGGNVDLRTVALLYGVQTQEPDYLDYDIKVCDTPCPMHLRHRTHSC
jgi:hypothetical protein